jgi:hypothetical protein
MKLEDLNADEMHGHAYTDWQPLMHQVIHKMIKGNMLPEEYHPDKDNVGGEVMLHAFNKALNSWNPKLTQFKTHLWNTVRGHLLNHYSKAQGIPTSLKNAERAAKKKKTQELQEDVKVPPQKPVPLPD